MNYSPKIRIRGVAGSDLSAKGYDNATGDSEDNNDDGKIASTSGKVFGHNIGTKLEHDYSSDDEKRTPELSETLQKHREMLREMKKKHRVSAKILRRVRKRDLHRHQIQQQAYHAFLSDTLTSCSESFYSESLYSALDQLSIETPNLSLLITETPNKKQGSVASLSPSFSPSLSSSYSSSFPYSIEESASTEKKFSWKQENEVETDSDYSDENFSRLFKRDRQPHQRNSRPTRKIKGLASVYEEVDGDIFFDSLEVAADDEEEVVDKFIDCVPTPERISHSTTSDASHPSTIKDNKVEQRKAFVDTIESTRKPFEQSLEKEQSEKIICVPQVIEYTGEELKIEFAKNISSTQTICGSIGKDKSTGNNSFDPSIDEDKNECFVDIQKESEGVDAEKRIGIFGDPIVIEDDKDQNQKGIQRFSKDQFLQEDIERDMFQNKKEQPSFIENFDEDESGHFAETSIPCQAPHRIEETTGNRIDASATETEGENRIVDFAGRFSGGQLFRNSVENISFIEKIEGDQSGHFIERCSEIIGTEKDQMGGSTDPSIMENDENDQIDNPMDLFSDASVIEGADNKGLIGITSKDHSLYFETETTPFLSKIVQSEEIATNRALEPTRDARSMNNVDVIQKENLSSLDKKIEPMTNEVSTLNLPFLAGEEKQKIDDVLDDLFEEFHSMDSDESTKISKSKSTDIHYEGPTKRVSDSSQLYTNEGSRFEDTKIRQIENHEELMTEPIWDLDQNPLSISMFLRQEVNPDLAKMPERVDHDVGIDHDIVVPTPIKNEVKEIDDMLDNFLRAMAEIDDSADGGPNDDADDYYLNCTEDFIFPSPQRISIESSTLSCEDSSSKSKYKSEQKAGSVLSDHGQRHKSTEEVFAVENSENISRLKHDFALRTELDIAENEGMRNNRLESLSKGVQKTRKNPGLGYEKTDFASSAKCIPKEKNFQSIGEIDINTTSKLTRSSVDSESPKPKMKKDYVLPPFSPPDQSRSRITSPELNHSLCDNPGIFLSNAIGIDSVRPNDPVAKALSRDSSEYETDSVQNLLHFFSNTEQFPNSSSQAIIPFILPKATNDGYKRQANPIDTVLSQLTEDGIQSTNSIIQNNLDTSDLANASSEAISSMAAPQAICDDFKGSNNNVASTLSEDSSKVKVHLADQNFSRKSFANKSDDSINPIVSPQIRCDDFKRPKNLVASALSRDSSKAKTSPIKIDSIKSFANNSNEATDPLVSPQAICGDLRRPNNPVASMLSSDYSRAKTHPIHRNIPNIPIKSFANRSNDSIDPVVSPKSIRGESNVPEGGESIASNDDPIHPRLVFDQDSVSTISASSIQLSNAEKIDVDTSATASQLDLPVPLSYSRDSDESSCKSPSASPRRVSVKNNAPGEPDKSFLSIATPPPIPKKESTLTEIVATSGSKPPRMPLGVTPTTPNPVKIPFSRTTERLSEGSPSRHFRTRSRLERSPHRIETSRSPLFVERGEGRLSKDDNAVSWYTSPGRSRSSSAVSRQLLNSNRSIISPPNCSLSSPPGSLGAKNRSSARSMPQGTKSRKDTKRSPVRSETAQSTMLTYASPNRSMVTSSMRSPMRGFHSLASPPRSPAVSLFSRVPKGARSSIRRMQKKMNHDADEKTAHEDFLSVDTVRICTHKFVYKIHPNMGPCDRCWALASKEEREIFLSRGNHLRITKTRSGCQRSCAIFPSEGENGIPVRLCRPCFFTTHQQVDGSSRLQVYKGNHIKVRPPR